MSNIKPIKVCRACGSERLVEFLDLGEQYLSDFRSDKRRPPKFPLVAVFCENCQLVQLKHTPLQKQMYHERYGFKSGINNSIKADLDSIVRHAFQYKNDPKTWLDIASNDGTLLSYVPDDIYRVGVDPITFLCREAANHADLIINDYFNGDIGGEYDVITSISCFYDMPDPSKFVADVKNCLSLQGVWVIQQNYLLTTMQLNAVDNFCAEHIEYYTLLSLENLLDRFDLEVNEVSTSPINGGSIRTIVSHKGTFAVDPSVPQQRSIELAYGLGTIVPYKRFASEIRYQLDSLHDLVHNLKQMGNRIAILAASTRGATIWQSSNLGPGDIVYAIERNPAKVGKNFSAIGIPIVSEEFAREDKPDFMILGPWFFKTEVLAREQQYLRNGGRVIIPLPEVRIV